MTFAPSTIALMNYLHAKPNIKSIDKLNENLILNHHIKLNLKPYRNPNPYRNSLKENFRPEQIVTGGNVMSPARQPKMLQILNGHFFVVVL